MDNPPYPQYEEYPPRNQSYPDPNQIPYGFPYGSSPPNHPNPDPNPHPISPYLSSSVSLPSHPHNLVLQFSPSGKLQYPLLVNAPNPYDPYPPPHPTYSNPNLYPHPLPSSFHHIGSGHYDNPNHLCYPPSSTHDGLATSSSSSSLHHQVQRYDSFGSYANSPLSEHGGTFSGSQHGTSHPSSKGKSSMKVLLLHGSLDIFIKCAQNLPNKDMFHKIVNDLIGPRNFITSDPYVTVSVCNAVIARTYVINNNENPTWDQHFYVPVAHEDTRVLFTVKDDDVFRAQIIGTVSIPAAKIYTGERIDGTFPVLGPNGKPCNQGAVLSFSIQYIPVARLTMYHRGVTVGLDCKGVPNTYFPLRRGGKVTLYQDAHVPDNCLPNFWLENGVSMGSVGEMSLMQLVVLPG